MKIFFRISFLLIIALSAIQVRFYYLRGVDGTSIITTVLLILVLMIFFIFLSNVLFHFFKTKKELKKNIQLLIIVVFLSLLGIEFILKYCLKYNLSYRELNGDFFYLSLYKNNYRSQLLTHEANNIIRVNKKEFSYSYKTNSLGFRNREINVIKPEDEIRILCLGDSFTEGVGAISEKDPWPRVLEQKLIEHTGKNINTINAGIVGSDQIFQYKLLSDIFIDYKPDIVMVAVNDSDIEDVIVRGGFERFLDDGSVQLKPPPKWEILYASSFIVRYFIKNILNYNYNLISPQRSNYEENIAIETILSVLNDFKNLSTYHDFKLMVILHPHNFEIISKNYKRYGLYDKIFNNGELISFDLMEYFLSTTKITSENYLDYFWKFDAHHNKKGYHEFAKGVSKKIVRLNWL